jgi:hypothetical protein
MRARSTYRLFSTVLAVAVVVIAAVATAQNTAWWPVAGQNLFNTHSQPSEDQISPENVGALVQKWVLTTAGNVTATPTVYQGFVYVPDMGGTLWAVSAGSGQVRWSRTIASYTGIANDVSRTSPAIAGRALILGDGWIRNQVTGGAHVFAVDRMTGDLIWRTKVHEHIGAIVTASPVVHNGVAYVGVAAKEEGKGWPSGPITSAARFAARSWRSTSARDRFCGRPTWSPPTTAAATSTGPTSTAATASGDRRRSSIRSAVFCTSGPRTTFPRHPASARTRRRSAAWSLDPAITSMRSSP